MIISKRLHEVNEKWDDGSTAYTWYRFIGEHLYEFSVFKGGEHSGTLVAWSVWKHPGDAEDDRHHLPSLTKAHGEHLFKPLGERT